MSLALYVEPDADEMDASQRSTVVTLADGSPCDLSNLSVGVLRRLQYEQEQAFAARFVNTPKGSAARAAAFAHGYDTVTAIFAAQSGQLDRPLVMGMSRRHETLVARLLESQRRFGLTPRLFEIGYGSGGLLASISTRGFAVGGIEVSPAMRDQALRFVDPSDHEHLLLGSFLDFRWPATEPRPTLVYWNDVFEHIPPDEIADYLAKIHDLLPSGGLLVTITPNWHIRPNDITAEFHRPRTEARGVHLREYTLREVTALLRKAGFSSVATPLFATPSRIALAGNGLAPLKRLVEPFLEWLPFRVTHLLTRGFALSCTIARRQ